MSIQPNQSILIVEDDEGIAILQKRALTRHGFTVTCVTSIDDALNAVLAEKFDLIVSDYLLQAGTGLDLLSSVCGLGLRIPIILVSGYSDEATIIDAMRCGVHDFVSKSADYLHYLPNAVERVLSGIRIQREIADSRILFQSFIDNSPAASFIKDSNGLLIYVNKYAQQIVGRDDWLGKSDFDLWPEAMAKSIQEHDLNALKGDSPSELLESFTFPNGLDRHFRTYRFSWTDSDGRRLLGGISHELTRH